MMMKDDLSREGLVRPTNQPFAKTMDTTPNTTIVQALSDSSHVDTIAQAHQDGYIWEFSQSEYDPEQYVFVQRGRGENYYSTTMYWSEESGAGKLKEMIEVIAFEQRAGKKREVVDSVSYGMNGEPPEEPGQVVIEDERFLAFLIDDIDADHLEWLVQS